MTDVGTRRWRAARLFDRRCHRRTTLAAVLAAAITGGGALAGCTSARNTLATPVSGCFRALPVAAAAVHHQGSFAGVRLVGARVLRSSPVLAPVVSAPGSQPAASVCVVAFRGSFASSGSNRVDALVGPMPTGTSRYALVLVAMPGDRLLGTVLVDRSLWGGLADLL